MNRKKKAVISLSAVFLLVCGIVGGIALYNNMIGDVSKVDVDSLPIKTMKGSFVYDTTNIKEAVGIVDYVFVGNVVSNDGTVYEDIVAMEDKNGRTKEVGTPYTNYTVRVLDNIKGGAGFKYPDNSVCQSAKCGKCCELHRICGI